MTVHAKPTRPSPLLRWASALLLLPGLLTGCGSTIALAGEAGPMTGVRLDATLASSAFQAGPTGIPLGVLATLDLPASLVADTLLLPVSAIQARHRRGGGD